MPHPNLYLFVANNPANLTDPRGEDPFKDYKSMSVDQLRAEITDLRKRKDYSYERERDRANPNSAESKKITKWLFEQTEYVAEALWEKGVHPDTLTKIIEPTREQDDSGTPKGTGSSDPTSVVEAKDEPNKPPLLELRGRGINHFLVPTAYPLTRMYITHEGPQLPIHAWLNLRDKEGKRFVLQAWASTKEDPVNQGHIVPQIQPGKDESGVRFNLDLSGVDVGAVVESLKGAEASFKRRWLYDPLNGNSSTFIAEALKESGVAVAAPTGALGWTARDRFLRSKTEEEFQAWRAKWDAVLQDR